MVNVQARFVTIGVGALVAKTHAISAELDCRKVSDRSLALSAKGHPKYAANICIAITLCFLLLQIVY